jgi:chromosome segregation ATPase
MGTRYRYTNPKTVRASPSKEDLVNVRKSPQISRKSKFDYKSESYNGNHSMKPNCRYPNSSQKEKIISFEKSAKDLKAADHLKTPDKNKKGTSLLNSQNNDIYPSQHFGDTDFKSSPSVKLFGQRSSYLDELNLTYQEIRSLKNKMHQFEQENQRLSRQIEKKSLDDDLFIESLKSSNIKLLQDLEKIRKFKSKEYNDLEEKYNQLKDQNKYYLNENLNLSNALKTENQSLTSLINEKKTKIDDLHKQISTLNQKIKKDSDTATQKEYYSKKLLDKDRIISDLQQKNTQILKSLKEKEIRIEYLENELGKNDKKIFKGISDFNNLNEAYRDPELNKKSSGSPDLFERNFRASYSPNKYSLKNFETSYEKNYRKGLPNDSSEYSLVLMNQEIKKLNKRIAELTDKNNEHLKVNEKYVRMLKNTEEELERLKRMNFKERNFIDDKSASNLLNTNAYRIEEMQGLIKKLTDDNYSLSDLNKKLNENNINYLNSIEKLKLELKQEKTKNFDEKNEILKKEIIYLKENLDTEQIFNTNLSKTIRVYRSRVDDMKKIIEMRSYEGTMIGKKPESSDRYGVQRLRDKTSEHFSPRKPEDLEADISSLEELQQAIQLLLRQAPQPPDSQALENSYKQTLNDLHAQINNLKAKTAEKELESIANIEKLRRTIEAHTKQIQNLQETNQSLAKEHENIIEEYKIKNKKTIQKCLELDEENLQLREENKVLEDNYKSLLDQNEQSAQEFRHTLAKKDFGKGFEELNLKIEELETEKQHQASRVRELENALKDYDKVKIDKESLLSDLQVLKKTLEDKESEIEVTRNQLKITENTFTQRISTLEEDINNLLDKIKSLEDYTNKLQAENTIDPTEIKNLHTEYLKTFEELESLKENYEKALNQIELLKSQLTIQQEYENSYQEQEENLKRKNKEINYLKQQLSESKDNYEQDSLATKDYIYSLSTELDKIKEEKADLQNQNEEYLRIIQELQTECKLNDANNEEKLKNVKDDLEKALNEIESLKSSLISATHEYSSIDTEKLNQLEQENRAKSFLIEELKENNQKLLNEIQNFKGTLSKAKETQFKKKKITEVPVRDQKEILDIPLDYNGQYEKEIKSLRETIFTLEDKLKSSETQLNQKEVSVKKLQKTERDLKSKIEDLEHENLYQRGELFRLHNLIDILDSTRQFDPPTSEDYSQKIATLEKDFEKIILDKEREIEDLKENTQDELEKSQKIISDKETKIKNLEIKQSKLIKDIQTLNNEQLQYREKIFSLEQELEAKVVQENPLEELNSLKKAIEDREEIIRIQFGVQSSIEKEAQESKQNLINAELKISELNEAIASLNQQYTDYYSLRENQIYNEYVNELQKFTDKIEQLSILCSQKDAEIKTLSENLEEAKLKNLEKKHSPDDSIDDSKNSNN